jgi:O-antigen/teichoic acid export membrane protein
MKSSQHITLNAGVSFLCTILSAGLALLSSRWVLNGLGQVDFGIYSIVGSLIFIIVFLNAVMAGSVSRHFAFAIGQGDLTDVNRWFNAALSIHLVMASALVLFGWFLGEYLILNWLVLPPERISVSIWVFRISLVSTFFGMTSIPFVAMFTARQCIAELSVFGVTQSLFSFVLAWWVSNAPGDRLLLYAVGMAAIPTCIYAIQILRAIYIFHECQINKCFWFDRKRLLEIFSFAVWSLVGGLGLLLRNQGSAILLNIYFGAKVNASYGIANQVSNQTNQLAAVMMGAFTPEITASEGRGNRDRMLSLSLRVCKMGTILILLIVVPLQVELEYVLKLWLKEPPVYTALFCRFILITFLIDRITAGYMMAVNAFGRIAAYQATLGGILLLTLPLAWFFLSQGFEPTSIGVAFVITMSFCSLGRVVWVKYLFNVPVNRWVRGAFAPCALVGFIAFLGACVPFLLLPESFGRLVLTTASSTIMAVVATWFFGFDNNERIFFKDNILGFIRRITTS